MISDFFCFFETLKRTTGLCVWRENMHNKVWPPFLFPFWVRDACNNCTHNAPIAVTDGRDLWNFRNEKGGRDDGGGGKLRGRKGLLSMQLLTAIWFIADHWSRSGSRLDRLDIYNFARMHTRLAHHFFISIQIKNYWNDLLHISPLWFLASRAPLFRDTWSTFLGRKDIPFASDSYSQSDPPRALVTFASLALVSPCFATFTCRSNFGRKGRSRTEVVVDLSLDRCRFGGTG